MTYGKFGYIAWRKVCMIYLTPKRKRCQWPFQGPKLEVPNIYIMPIFKGLISGNILPKYGQKYGTNVPPFEDPEDLPLTLLPRARRAYVHRIHHEMTNENWCPPRTRFRFCPLEMGARGFFLWTGPMFNPKHRIWIFTSYSISVVLERQMISLNIYISNWNPDHISIKS